MQKAKDMAHLQGLQLQALATKTVTTVINNSDIVLWSKTVEYLSTVLHNFVRKAMLQVLSTASNLFRWKRTTDASCPLCSSGKVQTNKHVLSNCSSATALHRYTTRHNDVLKLLIGWLQVVGLLSVSSHRLQTSRNPQTFLYCQ